MKSRILGTTLPVLEIFLEQNDKLISKSGQFSWMSPDVQLQTNARTGGANGLFGVLGRAWAGGGLFMNEYSTEGGKGLVAFAAKVPGSINKVKLDHGSSYMVHRSGYLCSTAGVDLSIAFQKSLGAGIFGGDGFILEKISGSGTAWVELGGEVVTYDLAPGEAMHVHPGHVGMFEGSVKFSITMMRGLKNAIFGGDGIFIARLTGPGKIWLQSTTMPNLAHALLPYLAVEATPTVAGSIVGGSLEGVGKVAGAVVGNVIDSIFE